MSQYIRIATSTEQASLERLEKFLVHYGIDCQIRLKSSHHERFHLFVKEDDLPRTEKVLQEIAYNDLESSKVEDIVEINFQGTERTEVAAWLQVLLDEEDREGSPIYFYKHEYEAILDALAGSEPVQIPYFILRGLRGYIPPEEKRLLMGNGLQEFFILIESVVDQADP